MKVVVGKIVRNFNAVSARGSECVRHYRDARAVGVYRGHRLDRAASAGLKASALHIPSGLASLEIAGLFLMAS